MRLRFRKPRINSRDLISIIVIIILLVGIGVYAYLQRTGKISIAKPQLQTSTISSVKQQMLKNPAPATESQSLNSKGLSVVPTPEGKVSQPSPSVAQKSVYKEKAAFGDGITNLARRALKQYLQDNGNSLNLTPEHKIYIEDYIQKHIGNRWLKLGEEIDISTALIKQAISHAQKLTPAQLDNLKQYAALVYSL